jgi:hypothetical protein
VTEGDPPAPAVSSDGSPTSDFPRLGCAFAIAVAIVVGVGYRHFGIGVIAGGLAFFWYVMIASLLQTRSVSPWFSIGVLIALAALLAVWRVARGESVGNAIQFATLAPVAVGLFGGFILHKFDEYGGAESLRRGGAMAWLGLVAGLIAAYPVAALYDRIFGRIDHPLMPAAIEVAVGVVALGAGLGAAAALRRGRRAA